MKCGAYKEVDVAGTFDVRLWVLLALLRATEEVSLCA
jgi:hypothetical protein